MPVDDIEIKQHDITSIPLTIDDGGSPATPVNLTGLTVVLTVSRQSPDDLGIPTPLFTVSQSTHTNAAAGETSIPISASNSANAGNFVYEVSVDGAAPTSRETSKTGNFIILRALRGV